MINQEILIRVRNGISAIGYTTIPRREFARDPLSPNLTIVGTGFMVRETTLMTNRHVIEQLEKEQAANGIPDDDRVIMFVVPRSRQGLQAVLRLIRGLGTLAEKELDVGFVEFNIGPEDQFDDISPLDIQSDISASVTEPIAVAGYPYGHFLLQRDGKVHRWGPVVQRGHISAISPFDNSASPDELLLDVRVAGGMSGAPIFRPANGTVIGILHSTVQATTALGLPLTQDRVLEWLGNWDKARAADGS